MFIKKYYAVYLAVLSVLAGLVYAACNSPMGMGPPVDTTAPQIYIDSPFDNQIFGSQTRGQPIVLSGRWYDDMGVTEIQVVDLHNESGRSSFSRSNGSLQFNIDKDGTWTARILIDVDGQYRLKVTGLDNFKNSGAAIVNIRVHLRDPWIKDSTLVRHPRHTPPYRTAFQSRAFYDNLKSFLPEANKDIEWGNIDFYQNEKFTLVVNVIDDIQVRAARLVIYDDQNKPLGAQTDESSDASFEKLSGNPFIFIKPTTPLDPNFKEWKWDIDDVMLNKLRPEYSNGAHYISFEVWAWNEANWDVFTNTPIAGASYMYENVKGTGTCWYPASDVPIIKVTGHTRDEMEITVLPDTPNAIMLEFFDDDQLIDVYAGLVSKSTLDTLRGSQSETQYINSLETNETARNNMISTVLGGQNLLGPNTVRRQTETISTVNVAAGEYFLIALAADDKMNTAVLDTKNPKQWSVYPRLKVYVDNFDAPRIYIESPEKANIFPPLDANSEFTVTAYTIDKQVGTSYLQVAWIPDSLAVGNYIDDTQNLLRGTNIAEGGSTTSPAGIKIWRLPRNGGRQTTVNGYKDSYSRKFHIINDFQFNSATENKQKIFVLHTFNGTLHGFQTLTLLEHTTPPAITMGYPARDPWTHDTNNDLVLRMTVDSVVGIPDGGVTITDITTTITDPGHGFSGAVVRNGREYRRTVPSDTLKTGTGFGEGSVRKYEFKVVDILGLSATQIRTITMSSIPVLQNISSSNAPVTYGIGEWLTFQADFTLPVIVNVVTQWPQGPQLRLYFTDPSLGTPTGANTRNAAYVSGPEGKTIVFRYQVQEGDNAARLYNSITPIYPISRTTAEAQRVLWYRDENNVEKRNPPVVDEFNNYTDNSANLLQNRVPIALDGIRPTITGVTFSGNSKDGLGYYNNGKTIILSLTVSEPVKISGAPTALLSFTGGTHPLEAQYRSFTNSANSSVITFTHVVNETAQIDGQLQWTGIRLNSGDSITDTVGNSITLPAVFSGDRTGSTKAYIDTNPPVTPAFTLHSTTDAPAQGNTLTGDIKTNREIYIRLTTGVETYPGTTRYYSVTGGSSPSTITGNYGTISDADVLNNNSSTYKPSVYQVTAWQEDRAGNRSLVNAGARNVTINSRSPELLSISCAEPDGYYTTGANLEFRLTFDREVRLNNGAASSLNLKGTTNIYDGPSSEDALTTFTRPSNTILSFTRTVPTGKRMADIKAQSISFVNMIDEYGNALKNFSNTVTVEDALLRPIANNSGYNLTRPNLIVDSMGPYIVTYSPANPAPNGNQYNGGVLTGTQIVLTFDKQVSAVAGKTITIRPWGKWAVPPVLSAEDFDKVYNSSLFGTNKTEYQRILKWIDNNNLPLATYANVQNNLYNYYTYTTHGVINKNNSGKVRPDTEAKWVLAFKHDLYEGVDRLRNVFNAAKWKWQEIPVTSASIDGAEVTITLLEPLDKGRIWEVLIDDQAFMDNAGNYSVAITAGGEDATTGKYRFWSAGTEQPVIRVDRYSHGDNYHGVFDSNLNGFSGWGVQNRPKIDTRVRIDCETPGASINYDTIRTSFTPAAGGNVFTSTDATAAGFFGHSNANNAAYGNSQPAIGIYNIHNEGYANTWIGNGGSHHDGAQQPIPRDGDQYFNGLLVPNVSDDGTSAVNLVSANGAIQWNNLTAKGTGLVTAGNLNNNGREYKNITAHNWNLPAGSPVFLYTDAYTNTAGYFFYVGDAYAAGNGNMNDRNASGDNDARLFSGRRDYIAAAAQKKEVAGQGAWSGPSLTASVPAYEGVFKTTVLYRNPNGRKVNVNNENVGTFRILIQGFDTPANSTVAGFPLNESTTGTPAAPYNGDEYSYFTKQAWRVGEYNDPLNLTLEQSKANNNYIWVSWEILTDWYLKGRNLYPDYDANTGTINRNNVANAPLQRDGKNYGAVLATYGAVTYRFEQHFDCWNWSYFVDYIGGIQWREPYRTDIFTRRQ